MTNFRALCAELTEALSLNDYYDEQSGNMAYHTLLQRTRTALSQPEPEGPTDEEVDAWADKNDFVQGHGDHPCGFWVKDDDLGKIVRAALARWGTPNSTETRRSLGDGTQPVSVSERLPEEPLAWWFTPESDEEYGWWVLETEGMERVPPPTHWLPAHALPVPNHTSEND